MKMTGGEAAVKSLKKENVKHVFGLIGSATMEMFDHETFLTSVSTSSLK